MHTVKCNAISTKFFRISYFGVFELFIFSLNVLIEENKKLKQRVIILIILILWAAFSLILTEYGEIRNISPY